MLILLSVARLEEESVKIPSIKVLRSSQEEINNGKAK